MKKLALLGLIVLGCMAFGAQSAFAGAVIDNGTIRLGINDEGDLNFAGDSGLFGVNYIPTGFDGTRAGCRCEGWGAGVSDGANTFSGSSGRDVGSYDTTLESFTSTASTAKSVTNIDGKLRVTQEFAPSPSTPNLYEIKVTLENLTAGAFPDVRYSRGMDWDIEPTPFSEFVTVQRGTTPAPAGNLLYSDDNGFNNPDPFSFRGALLAGTTNSDFVDSGPSDHGAMFDLGFGALGAGETKQLSVFYGAAATEAEANTIVSAAGLELFSYGQPNGGETTGEPTTFIWGFKAVGGAPVIPPTLSLTPESATNPVGTSHTVTAELKDSGGDPVPGAPIVFEFTGANAHAADSETTGADGKATSTYTGTAAGDDNIKACLDNNNSGACDPDEVTDTATKKWVGKPGTVSARGTVTSTASQTVTFSAANNCTAASSTRPSIVQWPGNRFTKTSVTDSLCFDDPGVAGTPASGFDTHSGKANGTLQAGGTGTLEWKYVDGAPSGSPSDKVQFVVKNGGGTTLLTVNTQSAGALQGSPGGVWTFAP